MASEPWSLVESSEREDATRLFLARLFWRTSSPLVASLLLGSCASEPASTLSESNQALDSRTMHCDQGRWRPMSALRLTEPADFVALRSMASIPRPSFSQEDAAGKPCAKASDPRLCEAELTRVSLFDVQPGAHLVFTRGDTVRALQTLEEKLSLLGTIDTPDEALLVLRDSIALPLSCIAGSTEAIQVRLRAEGGYRIATQQGGACGPQALTIADVAPNGVVSIVESQTGSIACPQAPAGGVSGSTPGRRPPNLCQVSSAHGRVSARARYFAEMAYMEAASVPAFEQLDAELRVFDAPRALREAAQRAAADEVQHARLTSQLAERFGARPAALRLSRQRLRSRAEVALDNAVEGCVHETYSAYLATAQARVASDPMLRGALQRIATEETAHAALAWQLSAWLEPRLTREERARIDQARLRAIAGLGQRTAAGPLAQPWCIQGA